ncbi:MAG: hypothetical protein Q4D26_08870 [Clostridia bacterium]|nr:hypothetical protein [Clostridia bacterium]
MENKKRKSLNCVYIDILRMMLYPLSAVVVLVLSELGISENTAGWISVVVLGILFVFYVVYKVYWGIKNIKTAVRLTNEENSDSLLSFMKITKFGSIPLYIIVFLINLFMWFLFVVSTRGMAIFTFPFMIAPTVFFTYLNVVFTAVFTIGFLIIKKDKGDISLSFVVINGILQFCFVLDVIDTIYLCVKFRKKKIEV